MTQRRRAVAACAAVACLLGAVTPAAQARPTHAPKPAFSLGTYTGTVTQRSPAAVGAISFVVSRRAVSTLQIHVAELCGNLLWAALGDAPRSLQVPIARNGSFAYDRTQGGDHVSISGRIHGSVATGTVFDALRSGGLSCAMPHPAAFTAER